MLYKSVIALVAGLLILFPGITQAEEVELIYDDGNPEGGFAHYEAGTTYAARLTPPAGEWKIKTARYYVHRVAEDVGIRVLGDNNGKPGTDLIKEFTVRPSSVGWLDVDLSQYDIWVTGDFYPGYKMLTDDMLLNPSIGYDTRGNERAWTYVGTRWLFNEYTTYFIRAVVTNQEGIEEELIAQPALSIQCYPNSIVVNYTLPQASRVVLTIWDASGRLMKLLADDIQSQGTYRLQWNGKDDDGNLLPQGVYFLRLNAAGGCTTQRIVVIK